MSSPSSHHVDDVSHYYQRNTKAFLRLGENDGYPAIHIALWPEGVTTVPEALAVAHGLVLDALQRHDGPLRRVVDLGCGMGAALAYLHDRLDSNVALEGLTLGTPPPKLTAQDADRIRIQEADFHRADEFVPSCSAAFCIEAVAHSGDLDAFFGAVSRALEPGGRLIVMDDFAVSTRAPSRPLVRYRAHWLAPGVRPLSEVRRIAGAHGLRLDAERDLTPWIRLGRPRDKLIRWTRPLWGWLCRFSEYAKSLSGGDARQRCLRSGETRFQMLEFVKIPDD